MGNLNISKILKKDLTPEQKQREIDQLLYERFQKVNTMFNMIDFKKLYGQKKELKIVDLGCMDGSLLLSIANHYPGTELYGLKHNYDEYKDSYSYLKKNSNIKIIEGSWYDKNIFKNTLFDIVLLVDAWPYPKNYAKRFEEYKSWNQKNYNENKRISKSNLPWQYKVFNKDYSIKELELFANFVKSGGFLIIHSWREVSIVRERNLEDFFKYKVMQKPNLGIEVKDFKKLQVFSHKKNILILKK